MRETLSEISNLNMRSQALQAQAVSVQYYTRHVTIVFVTLRSFSMFLRASPGTKKEVTYLILHLLKTDGKRSPKN